MILVIKAKNKLGLVFFPAYDWAISPSHPEREERLLYTQDQIFEEGIQDIEGIKLYKPKIAEIKDVERVHFCVPTVKDLVTQSHLVSVGGAVRAMEALMEKEVDKSFALIRPPGHHAHKMVYGDRGFCIVNMEAIMVERLRQVYGDLKVAIIDSDCHHGDGTQDIYWNDKDTLFISFHQDGRTLYPGTGSIDEFGGPSAYGYNINIPLPPETGDQGILYVLNNVVMPILDQYKPDLVINSAGQDNHYSDPITNMRFTAQGYAKLNEILKPDIAVLEGGYSIEGALPYVNLGIILAMAGLDYSQVKEPDYNPKKLQQPKEITDYIKRISSLVYNKWENRDELAQKEFKGLTQLVEERQIYYDTDNILDRQKRSYNLCKKCQGLEVITSKSSNGYNVLALTIPRKACQSCIDEGYERYKNEAIGRFSNIYLQDRVNDSYHYK